MYDKEDLRKKAKQWYNCGVFIIVFCFVLLLWSLSKFDGDGFPILGRLWLGPAVPGPVGPLQYCMPWFIPPASFCESRLVRQRQAGAGRR